jgi:hypothetical protein
VDVHRGDGELPLACGLARPDDHVPGMRRVVLWMGMSLNGYTSGPDEQLDWLAPHITPQAHAYFKKMRERSDTILVGRINYEGFLGYWPKIKDDPKASRDEVEISRLLDDVSKVVFSRTLRAVRRRAADRPRPGRADPFRRRHVRGPLPGQRAGAGEVEAERNAVLGWPRSPGRARAARRDGRPICSRAPIRDRSDSGTDAGKSL